MLDCRYMMTRQEQKQYRILISSAELVGHTFNEVSAFVDEQGNVLYEHTSRAKRINRFQVIDKETYSAVMTPITAQLLSELDH